MSISWCYIKELDSKFCSQLSHVLIIAASSSHWQCQKYFIALQYFLVASLNPTLCDHYLQEPLVSTFMVLLISAAHKCLIMPHPACSHLNPKANSSVLIPQTTTKQMNLTWQHQPTKWESKCNSSLGKVAAHCASAESPSPQSIKREQTGIFPLSHLNSSGFYSAQLLLTCSR